MIRRISKNNDYKDIIRSCPTGVVDDIYAIEYYVQGWNTFIQADFSKKGTLLEVILPSSELQTLPDGILMRRALYSNPDPAYPDGNYNLEFVDDLGVWLEGDGTSPGPGPASEYVTEEELEETLADYATQENLTTLEDRLLTEIDETKRDLQDEIGGVDQAVGDLSDSITLLDGRVTNLEGQNCVQYNEDNPLYDGYNKVITTFRPGNGNTPLLILVNNENSSDEQYDGIRIDDSGIYKYSANNYQNPGSWTEYSDELATKDWVQNQGYLVNDSVDPYATCGWVQTRGYLTSGDLGGYATESWVQNQGYASDSDLDALDARVSILEHGGIPSSVAWGGISGTVTDQTDLVNYIGSRGFLTSSDLSGYATQQWVGQQGYITSVALSGYATETWVQNQGYLSSATLSDYVPKQTVIDNDKVFTVSPETQFIHMRRISDSMELRIETNQIKVLNSSGHTLMTPNSVGVVDNNNQSAQNIKVAGAIVDTNLSEAVLVVRDGNDSMRIGCNNIYLEQSGVSTSISISDIATQSWATNQFLEESKVWTGTETQWNQLTAVEKASYTIALVTQ